MKNPFYFTLIVLKTGFNKSLDSHQNNHTISTKFIIPKYLEIEILHVKNIVNEIVSINESSKNQ